MMAAPKFYKDFGTMLDLMKPWQGWGVVPIYVWKLLAEAFKFPSRDGWKDTKHHGAGWLVSSSLMAHI